MDKKLFLFVLILGLFMIFMLNWIYFFDWDKLINKLVEIISKKPPSHNVKDSQKYRRHVRRWKHIFLVQPFLFAMLLSILTFCTKQMLISFGLTMMVTIIGYTLLEKYEKKNRPPK